MIHKKAFFGLKYPLLMFPTGLKTSYYVANTVYWHLLWHTSNYDWMLFRLLQ